MLHPRLLLFATSAHRRESGEGKDSTFHVTRKEDEERKPSNFTESMHEKVDRMTSRKNASTHTILSKREKEM